ncbi:cytochrome P450 [Xylariaceae sp. FL1272]|nr:cytochrome P450 [Xylariaceae sp. FL1272]
MISSKVLATDPGYIPILIAVILVGWYVTSTTYSWQKLRHVPGPRLASFSYLWIANVDWTGRQYDEYREFGEKYGPLARIGPNDVISDDPEIIRRMSVTGGQFPRRSTWNQGMRFNPYHDVMFNIQDTLPHDKIKAKISPGYSGRETPGFEDIVDEQVTNLIRAMEKYYLNDPKDPNKKFVPMDLSKMLPLFTLDVISHLTLGKEFGCLEENRDIHHFYDTLEEFFPVMAVSTDVPWIRRILYSKLGLWLIGPRESDKKGLGKLMKMTNDHVRRRYQEDAPKQHDMLGSFKRHGLTQAECESELLFSFVAGSDTTATVLRLMMLYVIISPVVYQKLKAEVVSAVREGRVSHPITSTEAKRLPYLQAVIYEGMRMRPVANSLFPKEIPPGGDTINGHYLPAGTAIGMNLASMLRSKSTFGDDADLFRPERFLEANEEVCAERFRVVDLTFGSGRWMCSGKSIAWHELNKIPFELMREFDIQLIDHKLPPSRSHGFIVDGSWPVYVTRSAAS